MLLIDELDDLLCLLSVYKPNLSPAHANLDILAVLDV